MAWSPLLLRFKALMALALDKFGRNVLPRLRENKPSLVEKYQAWSGNPEPAPFIPPCSG
jgi:hypothetical protein